MTTIETSATTRQLPDQYVRRPEVHPSNARGRDRSELGVFLFTAEQFDREHDARCPRNIHQGGAREVPSKTPGR